MGIHVEIVPFGNLMLVKFFLWGWRRKSRRKRFGDEDGISSSAPTETPPQKTIKITLKNLYLSTL
jgi:hypothetical protein